MCSPVSELFADFQFSPSVELTGFRSIMVVFDLALRWSDRPVQSTPLHLIIFHDAFRQSLQLKSKHTRVIPRQAEIAAHEPETLMASSPPYGAKLALFIKSPNIFNTLGSLITEDISTGFTETYMSARSQLLANQKSAYRMLE